MTTIKKAIDFASDNGVSVGVDVQEHKGCVETVKHFDVWKIGKSEMSIRVTQSFKGAKCWEHSGNKYYNRSAAIISAVNMITGVNYID